MSAILRQWHLRGNGVHWYLPPQMCLHCSNHKSSGCWESHRSRTQHFEPYTACYGYRDCVHSSHYCLPRAYFPFPWSLALSLSFSRSIQQLCGLLSLLVFASCGKFALFILIYSFLNLFFCCCWTSKKHIRSHFYHLKEAFEGQTGAETKADGLSVCSVGLIPGMKNKFPLKIISFWVNAQHIEVQAEVRIHWGHKGMYLIGEKEKRIHFRPHRREQRANIFAPETDMQKRVSHYVLSKHRMGEMIKSQDRNTALTL